MLYYAVLEGSTVIETHAVGNAENFTLPAGAVVIDADTFHALKGGGTQNQNGTFTPAAPVARRDITTAEFMDRWPVAVQVAIEVASENDPMLRVLMRNIQRPIIHLDSALLIQGLTYLRDNYVGAGKIWPDLTTADAFFAALRADG